MKIQNLTFLAFSIVLVATGCSMKKPHVEVKGEMMKWHTVVLEVPGHYTGEFDHKNPFLDYRLDVEFSNGDRNYLVPGYFGANGEAGKEGTSSGNIWKAKFTPDAEGTWEYRVHFEYGKGIAVSDSTGWGMKMKMDGHTGTFEIGPSDKEAPDFRAKGRLINTGGHYLVHAETGEPFIKTEAGSPENFLAYYGFDQTPPTHRYVPHAGDWKKDDPDWGEGEGRNIIGAVNYLSSKGVNSQYMLTMNVMGDSKDVWPWVSPYERTRYDVSKLEQWDWLFSYMQSKGMNIHLLTQERENQLLLDQGETGVVRKLYYRELIARFGHHLAVTINLGEENGYNPDTRLCQDTRMRKDMANYIKSIDPYGHLLVVHTHVAEEDIEAVLEPLLGFENLDGPSLQIELPRYVHGSVLRWRKASAEAGNPWICNHDEVGHFKYGVVPDDVDPEHDSIRQDCLWGTLMAGGAGVAWYFGYVYPEADLNLEDFRSRDRMWELSAIARRYFEELPVMEMQPADELVSGEDAWCMAKRGELYVIYLPMGVRSTTLSDAELSGNYLMEWFNPRTGETLPATRVTLNRQHNFRTGQSQDAGDWALKISREP